MISLNIVLSKQRVGGKRLSISEIGPTSLPCCCSIELQSLIATIIVPERESDKFEIEPQSCVVLILGRPEYCIVFSGVHVYDHWDGSLSQLWNEIGSHPFFNKIFWQNSHPKFDFPYHFQFLFFLFPFSFCYDIFDHSIFSLLKLLSLKETITERHYT